VFNDPQIELQNIQQLTQDWSVVPFTQVTLRTGKCAENEEAVFGVLWKGAEEGMNNFYGITRYS
jgi:hypothetical protein